MSKLYRRIFQNIMLVSVTVLVATLALIISVQYHDYSIQYVDSLTNEARCLAEATDNTDMDFLHTLETKHRLTVVASDGTVLYDNQVDASTMENHLNRPEISDALKTGQGFAERYSSTLSEKTANVAIRLENGDVLRLSDTQITVFSLLRTVAWPIVLVVIAAIGLSLLLAARMSKAILAPINKINLEHPEKTEVYQELFPLIQRIEAQNKQIAMQLENQKTEHEQQDAMRRDFTANVSHELKTPLTSISGYAEIIKTGIAREEDVPRFAGKIYEESQRLITLVGDIIKLSQLDSKEIPVKIEEIDLYDICTGVLSQLEMAAQEHHVTMSLTGERLKIRGAEQIVEEIIFNLCDNAVKYNKEGGSVELTLKQCVDGAELTVADTGIGIPQEDLGHVFERFYRVDKSHSKDIGGTGLGLSIVKHGARFLGANVSVESELGKGTKIRIVF